MSEYAVLLILALVRRLLSTASLTTAAKWAPGRDVPALTDQQNYVYNWIAFDELDLLYGKTVGIFGLGAIGSSVAERLRPFGVRLLYTQRHRLHPDEEARLAVEWRSLDDLLLESDVITLHGRLQEGPGGNEHMIGSRELALMKPSAYLVNTSRGRLIDEDALVAALRDGTIAGAGLDVFRTEPLPPDHPLLGLAGHNVILTAHLSAGSSEEWWRAIVRGMADWFEAQPAAAAGRRAAGS